MAQTLYGITAAALPTNLAKGYIPLPLGTARIISGDVIQNTTEAGVPDGNTDPILQRINSATDVMERIVWAAGSVIEIQFDNVAKPPDLDDTAAVIIKLLLDKDTNTDTAAVVGVKYFEGIGDTSAGGNTAALAVATLATYSVTVAAGDVAAAPGAMAITVKPGAHANDAVRCHGAWIEYTRKS